MRSLCGTKPTSLSLKEWIKWRNDHPLEGDLSDVFYLDQRLAGWLSAVEQSLDITEIVSLHPACNDRIIRLLMSCPETWNLNGELQRAVIDTLAPELLSVPINEPSSSLATRLKYSCMRMTDLAKNELRNALLMGRRCASPPT